MALKQDERALLQLVCERGQSYADIAELLGTDRDQVKAKARAALTDLGGRDPDAEVGLTDYLLGQADPIGRADVVRYLQQDPETLELAGEIATKLRALAPGAELPKLPEPRGGKSRAAATTTTAATTAAAASSPTGEPAPRRARAGGLTPRQSRIAAAAAGIGVLLVVGILAISGAFSSDDASGGSSEADLAEAQREVTSVDLEARGGSGVAGRAEFGLANDQLFVDLSVQGLDPEIGEDDVYVLWLLINENAGYPVSIIVPGENGSVSDRYSVPTPVAVAVGSNAKFVDVSQSPSRELRQQINEAVDNEAPLVPYSGESLARGRIPLAEQGGQGGQGESGSGQGESGSGQDGGAQSGAE